MLLAAGVGEVFGYATLQQGNLIHHLLPIQGEEQEQSGHSSTTTLDWHSEDAFTTARCDFLVLMALRNHQGVGTLYAPASVLDELDSADREILSQPRFVVRADDEHLKNVQAASDARLESIHDPERRITMTPILHGGIDLPHLVIDRVFMAARDGDEEASGAFARAVMAIDRHIQAVPLAPGDVFVIDNHRAVHGRAPFNARYDGSDRWLLKVSVTRDLMKSRSYRETAISRVVH